MNAAPEIAFSSEQGKANYAAARRQYPAQAIVNLKTMRDNMAHLVSVVGGPNSGTAVMGVVKADAYGHGLLPSALAALAGGATWLGTAQSHEALLLRKLGIGPDRCHILTWVYNGTEVPFDELIAADIDVSVGSLPGIDAVAAAARKLGKPARVHVKVDSGFGRNGFTPAGFAAALAELVPLAKEGVLHIVGQWSHLAVADSPDVPEFVASTDRQIETFKDFTARMEKAGIPPEIRHLANTAATLDRPEIHFELTRPGIGLYGYEPDPAMGTPRDWHLTPAMRLIKKSLPFLLFQKEDLYPDPDLFRQTIRYAAASALHQSSLYIGKLFIQGAVNTLGTESISAYTAAGRIEGLANAFGDSGAESISLFTSQNTGAGNKKRTRSGFYTGLIPLSLLGITMSLLMYITSGPGISLLAATTQPGLLNAGTSYIQEISYFYVLCFIGNSFVGFYRGSGHVSIPFIGTIIHISLRTLLTFLLIPRLGLPAVAISTGIGWIAVVAFQTIIYVKNYR